ncbi:MAG: HAD family hydrolase [Candidatus Hydrothermarchaeaceae archaeon]
MIKVVSFDADGTLVDKSFMDAFWNIGIPREYARQKGMTFDEAKEEVEKRYHEVGERDIRWYTPEYWFDLLGLTTTPRRLMEDYKDHLKVYPEATNVLEELVDKYPLVVISNAPREILAFELSSLDGYFAHVFSATTDFKEVRKTSQFYSRVCATLGIKPFELVHVGDHWDFDYVVPKKLGIKTFFLERTMKKSGANVIHSLEEFVDKIDG